MANSVALVNCNLVDVGKADIIPSATVLIKEGRIFEISRRPSCRTLRDYRVIDAEGLWGLPGLVDLHVHICEEPNPRLASSFSYDEDRFISGIRVNRNLRECLKAGITMVRDVGSYDRRAIEAREAFERRIIKGPRIVACGNLLTYPGGHFHTRGKQLRGCEAIRLAVREEVRNGASFIKVASDPEDDEALLGTSFSLEELTALVEVAHSLDRPVACHTFPSVEGLDLALRAGMDTLEHAAPLSNELLHRIIGTGTILVPTFVAAYDEIPEVTIRSETRLDWDRIAIWETANYPGLAGEESCSPSIETWFFRLLNHLPLAIQAGVRIGVGTDAGLCGTNFRSAVREVLFLTELGASNLQALQSAILVGVQAVGFEAELGRIEVGFLADLILVRDNPLDDIETLLDVRMTMVDGWIAWMNPDEVGRVSEREDSQAKKGDAE